MKRRGLVVNQLDWSEEPGFCKNKLFAQVVMNQRTWNECLSTKSSHVLNLTTLIIRNCLVFVINSVIILLVKPKDSTSIHRIAVCACYQHNLHTWSNLNFSGSDCLIMSRWWCWYLVWKVIVSAALVTRLMSYIYVSYLNHCLIWPL